MLLNSFSLNFFDMALSITILLSGIFKLKKLKFTQ